MHLKVLEPKARAIFKSLGSLAEKNHFILAGGTGLALQYGHRISVDFDFFTEQEFSARQLLKELSALGKIEIIMQETHTLVVLLDSVKISFFHYQDHFLFDAVPTKYCALAHVTDIALMKLVAIANRGARKDFIDLYFILKKNLSFKELWPLLRKKFSKIDYNEYHVLKSMNYFADAEAEPMPRMLVPCEWEDLKRFFLLQFHRELGVDSQ